MRIAPDISSQATTAADRQKQAKLVDAAQQFEGMLMQELLKPMQAGQDGWDDEEQNDPAAGTMSSYGTEAVANAIAKDGGLGIAKHVVQQVTQERQRHSEKKHLGTKVY